MDGSPDLLRVLSASPQVMYNDHLEHTQLNHDPKILMEVRQRNEVIDNPIPPIWTVPFDIGLDHVAQLIWPGPRVLVHLAWCAWPSQFGLGPFRPWPIFFVPISLPWTVQTHRPLT